MKQLKIIAICLIVLGIAIPLIMWVNRIIIVYTPFSFVYLIMVAIGTILLTIKEKGKRKGGR